MRPFALSLFSILLFQLIMLPAQAQPTGGREWYEKGKKTDDPLLKVEYFSKSLELEGKTKWTYYFRAWAYYELRRYDNAIFDFKKSLQLEGRLDHSYIWSAMAWCYYGKQSFTKAGEYAKKATKANPKNGSAWRMEGLLAIRDKEFAEAIGYLDKFIALQPDAYVAYSNRSYAHLMLENYEAVIADCDKGLNIKPGDDFLSERKALALMKLDRQDEAIDLIRDRVEYKEDDPISLSNIGDLYYSTGDYKTAIEFHNRGIELYKKKIAMDPKFIKVYRKDVYNIYMSRGDAWEALDSYQNAHASYQSATKINPQNYRAWLEIGELQTFQDNYREAVVAYEKAFDLKPDHPIGWVNLGFCYSNLGEEKKAIGAYTRGIKVNPDVGLLWNNRGYSYLEMKEYEKALSDLNKAIEVEPDIVMSHVSLGEYYYFTDNYDEAIKKLTECLKMPNGSSSAYVAAYYTRGLAWLKLKQYEKAEQDLQDAVNRDGDHILAWENLGIAHFEQKENCPAYKAFKEALRRDSMNREKTCKESAKYLARLTRNPCNE